MIVTRSKTSFFILKNSNILKNFNDRLKEILALQSTLITLDTKKGLGDEFEIVDKIYILAEGRAFLSCIKSDGRKIVLEDLEEGSIFGDLDFLGDNKYSNQAFFIEPFPKSAVKIYEFKKDEFLKILLENPNLVLEVLSVVSQRMSKLEKKIEELAFFSLKSRLLSELIRLAQPEEEKGFLKIKYRITHEKLGQVIGAVRETVSKTLSELKNDGYIFYDKKKNLIIKRKRNN